MSGLPPSWRDHRDGPADDRPSAPGGGDAPFYEPIGDFQGALYHRNAFAGHTDAEVEALRTHLELRPGTRLLDVGCGDGRHLRALAHAGVGGVGVDISSGLITAATAAASAAAGPGIAEVRFVRADARDLPDDLGTFDAAMTVCQGGFGTSPTTDRDVLAGLAAHVRPGGRVVVTAFHALFAARHLVEGDAYDVVHGVHHHRADVVGPDAERRTFDLWTAAYTVGELVARCEAAGLTVEAVHGVEPGRYGAAPVGLDDPELLAVARV